MTAQDIIDKLPYKAPFLFVESLDTLSEEGVTGSYTVKHDEYFFEGHFPGNPITPGVILLEIMAQIGLVSLGIYLKGDSPEGVAPFFASANVDFLAPVGPGDQLQVTSKKVYYRFNKLKCQVECKNLTTDKMVCKGELSGMIVSVAK